MTEELVAGLLIGARYVVCLLVPLIPAIVLFKLFPESKVVLKGPLEGLTARATGAFAGYVITFLIALPMTRGITELAAHIVEPVWSLQAEIVPINHDGEEIALGEFNDNVQVIFKPRLVRVGSNEITVQFPLTGNNLPYVVLEIPGFGAETVNLAGGEYEISKDEDTRTIIIEDPIKIRQFRE